MNLNESAFFAGFLLFIVFLLFLDLGIFNKREKVLSFKEAFTWTALWVLCALGFYLFLAWHGEWLHGITTSEQLGEVTRHYGETLKNQTASFPDLLQSYRKLISIEFITGYLLEESLSIDNVFIIMVIFAYFKVEKKHYHRVLFWGILGAVVLRFVFIFTGAALVARFNWILYIFAAFLVYTGAKMLFSKEDGDDNVRSNPVLRFLSKHFRIFPSFEGNRFFIKKDGKTFMTPLFLTLAVIECTDLVFAFDSIPAIFAVTKDPYIIFFSNIFAILGLRSLFFVLSSIVGLFHYFKIGLSLLIIFIGLKMFFDPYLHRLGFTHIHLLAVVLFILIGSIVASLIFPKRAAEKT